MNVKARQLQFIAWGSYDEGKPRVRMLLNALRERCVLASEINIGIWHGIEDKSVAGWARIFGAILRLVVGYPSALARLATKPRDQIIILPYPAIVDIFVLWPLARLRGQTIVFDAFISFYDTIVDDRKRLNPNCILSRWLWHAERAALKLADIILVDTDQHGQYFSTAFGISDSKFFTVPVGAEELFWDARNRPAASLPLDKFPPRYALFYGQLIPLHGIDTILEVVSLTEKASIHWVIVGRGQDEAAIRKFIERHAPKNLTWIPWVEYHSLPDIIRRATVSLGIFGGSDKAARVIPNKMFQVLAAGGSIITRESPPAAALASRFPRSIRLVPPGDASALAEAVIEAFEQGDTIPVPASAQEMLSPGGGIDELIRALDISRRPKKCLQ